MSLYVSAVPTTEETVMSLWEKYISESHSAIIIRNSGITIGISWLNTVVFYSVICWVSYDQNRAGSVENIKVSGADSAFRNFMV